MSFFLVIFGLAVPFPDKVQKKRGYQDNVNGKNYQIKPGSLANNHPEPTDVSVSTEVFIRKLSPYDKNKSEIYIQYPSHYITEFCRLNNHGVKDNKGEG